MTLDLGRPEADTEGVMRFSYSLPNLNLIRNMEEPYRWDAEAIQHLVGEVEDNGVKQLWMVCHVDETIYFLSERHRISPHSPFPPTC